MPVKTDEDARKRLLIDFEPSVIWDALRCPACAERFGTSEFFAPPCR